ncbi:MAG: hypothetical protein PHN82_03090 [bacterium]|nr:hypothetical protein [bacterium]
MAYRKIGPGEKVQAVIRVFGGESLLVVARDLGVSRNSVSLWIRRAKEAMRREFTVRRKGGAGGRNRKA